MLGTLLRQDLSQRFTGNVLGLGWALVVPVLQLALFALVFVHIFKARMPALGEGGYVVFLALGMWPWFAFLEAVGRGTTALTENAGLLGKVSISTWELVLARVLAAFVLHGAGFIVVVTLLGLWFGTVSPLWLPLTLPGWLGLFVLAVAVAQINAITNVFARDMQQIVPYLLNAWMFLTPILYDRATLPAWLAPWMEFNPLTTLIESIRTPLLYQRVGMFPWQGFVIAAIAVLAAYGLSRRCRLHVREFL